MLLQDVIVCIGFYQKERWAFFGISLAILCLACIAYDLAFMTKFLTKAGAGESDHSLLFFIVTLPVSPLIPFVFFFADKKESWLARTLVDWCCFEISFKTKSLPEDASKLRIFMEQKLKKHYGFIIEALVEGTE